MKALVTGAGGFLGLYVVEQLLEAGFEVRGFARGDYPELRRLGVEAIRGDIRDADAVDRATQGCDIVFHTAARAGIWGRWSDYYEINTVGTEHVIIACRKHAVPRLVFTSSPSVTFDGTEQCGVDEAEPYPERWLCHYPHSKALAEAAVLSANGEELMTCALRPHLIWGPRDPHLVPRLIDRAKKGQLRRVGSGENLVDMVYVENAAAAHLAAANAMTDPSAAVCGKAYFISQGEPVNCWQWIDDLLELAGLPKVQRSISVKAAWRVGALLEAAYRLTGKMEEPRMTRFLAAQLGRSHYFCIARAEKDFGYCPAISTDEGMRRLANSWTNG